MEELAEYALFGLLIRHTLAPGGIVGILTMLREAFKRGHEAGALDNYHQQVYSVGPWRNALDGGRPGLVGFGSARGCS